MTGTTSRGLAALAAVALLVLGAALGIMFDRFHVRSAPEQSGLFRIHDDPFSVIDSTLVLRDDQHDRVRAIIEARQQEIDGVWENTHRSLLAILDSTMSQLESVLDAGQRAKLLDLADALHSGQPSRLPH